MPIVIPFWIKSSTAFCATLRLLLPNVSRILSYGGEYTRCVDGANDLDDGISALSMNVDVDVDVDATGDADEVCAVDVALILDLKFDL